MPRSHYVLILVCLAALGGCSKSTSGPPTASVAGTVYLDGTPASDVEVTFLNGDFSVFGRTDAEGKYELVSGAAVGENKVYFSKLTGLTFELNPEEGMDEGQLMAMQNAGLPDGRTPKQLIPKQYSDPVATKVSFIVPDGGTASADFKLTTR